MFDDPDRVATTSCDASARNSVRELAVLLDKRCRPKLQAQIQN
jgi:hypothetical protein